MQSDFSNPQSDFSEFQKSRKERCIANSKTLVRYVTPFAIGWYIVALLLEAPRLEIAAAIATIGFLFGIVLHWLGRDNVARVTWILAANVAVFLASLVVHPSGYMSFILLAAAGIPFLIFPLHKNLPLVLGFVGLPVMLWFIGWGSDYSFLQPFDIGEQTATHIVAPGSAVTVFGVVLFEFAYFVSVSSRYAFNLHKAQQLAEVANEAKSVLLKSMSHEIRTPLNAITGYSELVREEARRDTPLDPAEVRQRMDLILNASSDLLSMMDNMLAFASIAGTEILTKLTAVALSEKVEKVLQRNGQLIAAKKLTLNLKVPTGLKVSADPALLYAAIAQLLDNAAKYTPACGNITVTAEAVSGQRVKLTFRDTGPGFPKEASTRAFDPFERLEFTNGTQSGAGIGLALVHAYVSAMGGEVGIDQSHPAGGVVWIVLDAA